MHFLTVGEECEVPRIYAERNSEALNIGKVNNIQIDGKGIKEAKDNLANHDKEVDDDETEEKEENPDQNSRSKRMFIEEQNVSKDNQKNKKKGGEEKSSRNKNRQQEEELKTRYSMILRERRKKNPRCFSQSDNNPLRRSTRMTKKALLQKEKEEIRRKLSCKNDRLIGLKETFYENKGRGIKVSFHQF